MKELKTIFLLAIASAGAFVENHEEVFGFGSSEYFDDARINNDLASVDDFENVELSVDYNIVGRISNGTLAKQGDIPYIVAVKPNGTAMCGGNIIDSKWVLTAAHCLYNYKYAIIIYGTVYISNPQFYYNISSTSFWLHPQFELPTHKCDIALIRIPEVTFTEYINLIQLPTTEINEDFLGRRALIAGWGVTNKGTTKVKNLLYAHVRISPSWKCAVMDEEFHKNNICVARYEGKNTCRGDSGGPLVVNGTQSPILVGVMSFGFDLNCETTKPVAFTRVTRHLDWIHETMKNNEF